MSCGEPETLAPPRLELHEISKSFGRARALRGVHLTVAGGEIHGLIGQNGAGGLMVSVEVRATRSGTVIRPAAPAVSYFWMSSKEATVMLFT